MIADAKQTISFTRSKYCRVANITITSTFHRPRRLTLLLYALQLHIAALWGNGKELFTSTNVCKNLKCCVYYHTKKFSLFILLEIIRHIFISRDNGGIDQCGGRCQCSKPYC